MTVEAPLSKYKKQNYLIMIVLFWGLAVVFAYDGFLSKFEWSMRYSFYEKHVIDNGGKPDSDMVFNQKAAPVLGAAGLAAVIFYFFASKKKIIADDSKLTVNGFIIEYRNIEKINKTHFDKKGYFIITYTDNGQSKELKLSDRRYDNMPAVLDHIVAKIS